MAFVRTISGLNNQHLFHNVDYVVFVEGGRSYTKIEIDQGQYNEESIDTIFWNKIFERYKQNSEFKFKAVGSKTAVLKIAEDIVQNNLTKVYVAMDQEFDTILAKLYKHNRILYTFGYSWENDVWNEKVVENIIRSITAKNIDPQLVLKPFEKFLKEIKLAVYTDGYLFSKNKSFFPRTSNHLRIIECNTNYTPCLKKQEVEDLICSHPIRKSNIYSYGSRKRIKSKQHCYGHLFGNFCRLLINHLLKTQFNLSNLGNEFIRRLAINYFLNHLTPEIDDYYTNLIE